MFRCFIALVVCDLLLVPRMGKTCDSCSWSQWSTCSQRCGTAGFRYRYKNKIVWSGMEFSCSCSIYEQSPCSEGVCTNGITASSKVYTGTVCCGQSSSWTDWTIATAPTAEGSKVLRTTAVTEVSSLPLLSTRATVATATSPSLLSTTATSPTLISEATPPASAVTTVAPTFISRSLSSTIRTTTVAATTKTTPSTVESSTASSLSSLSTKTTVVAEKATTAAEKTTGLGTASVVGVVVGSTFFVAFAACLVLYFRRARKSPKVSHRNERKSRKRINPKSSVNLGQEVELENVTDQWEVGPDQVTILEVLGQGAFGKVYKTILRTAPPREEEKILAKLRGMSLSAKNAKGIIVAVKTLNETAGSDDKQEFLKEINLMKKLGFHQNIVNFLGCCTIREPNFLVLEFLPKGDLLKYLRKNRHKISGFEGKETAPAYLHTKTLDLLPPKDKSEDLLSLGVKAENTLVQEDVLTPKDVISFSYQIAAGMEYLSSQGFVHRDLAARNVLVADNKQVKVSDFGLARDLYEESAYTARAQRKLPIKWMSPEAMYDQVFTSESDVWSYGVVLWEMFTLGGAPYPSMSTRELYRELRRGYRMEKPDMCSEEVYKVMLQCWQENPVERPKFTELCQQFEELLQADSPYMDFSILDKSKDYYLVPSFNSAEGRGEEDGIETMLDERVTGNQTDEPSMDTFLGSV